MFVSMIGKALKDIHKTPVVNKIVKRSIQIMSDVHLEFNGSDILKIKKYFKPCAKNLIVAGDVGYPNTREYSEFFKYVSENWKNVLYVTGNHEYYDPNTGYSVRAPMNKLDIDKQIETIVDMYPNVYLLNNDKIVIDDIEYIGSTLWSQPLETRGFTDFSLIYHNDEPLTKEIVKQWNVDAVNFIRSSLDEHNDKKKCVITHFMPLQNLDIPNTKYDINQRIDSYFGNYLYDLIKEPDLWISGHTHQSFDFEPKNTNTRWVCYPYGYPREQPNIEHDAAVIEL
jgi:hypothetical protein